MATTVSGHPVLTATSPDLAVGLVPGSTMKVRAAAWALPVLLDFERRWQAHPDLGRGRLNLSTGLNGSYAYRQANAADAFSDHCGYAVDNRYDVLKPDNRRHMTDREQAAVRQLLKDYGGALKWGGDYQRLIDEMHVYVAPGQNAATFRALRNRLGIQPNGTRGLAQGGIVTPPPPALPIVRWEDLKNNSRTQNRLVQESLNRLPGDRFSARVTGLFADTKGPLRKYRIATGSLLASQALRKLTAATGNRWRVG